MRDIDIQKQYNSIAQRYLQAKRNFFHDASDPATTFITKYISQMSGVRVADIGCGGGDEVLQYRAFDFANLIGIDPSESMVAEAQKMFGADNAFIGNWTSLPLPDASQDVLIGRFSLQYARDLGAAYTEAARVLAPGGLLLLALPNPDMFDPHEEYVRMSLYDDAVTVVYPRHTMDEFISEMFKNLFDIREHVLFKDTHDTFDAMAIAAYKR